MHVHLLTKAWSDIKNNTKKKWARIDRSNRQTGGGPALQINLTDIEQRVLSIIGVQAATGMNVAEVGFSQVCYLFVSICCAPQ